MAGGVDYDAGPLQLSRLRDQAKMKLVDILDSRRGRKLLVLDKNVAGSLGLLARSALFKEHGFEQMRELNNQFQDAGDANSVLYLVRSRLSNVQLIAHQIKQFTRQGRQLDIAVYFLPRKSTVCERIFQEAGVAANVTIGEFPLDFIPFDHDLLSLETESAFKEVALNRDWSSNLYMARGLVQIQQLYGRIRVFKGIGPSAKSVCDIMEAMLADDDDRAYPPGASSIDELVVIDRAVDTVTPMCMQLTYEGLIDELMSIRNGTVTTEGEGGRGKQRIPLNSSDTAHEVLRNQHIGNVGEWLSKQSQAFKTGYLESKGAELKELKKFVSTLTSLPQINRHVDLVVATQKTTSKQSFKEQITLQQTLLSEPATDADYQIIEDMILREEKLETVLRYLCLASLTQGGVPKQRFDSLRREIVSMYGHQHILTLQALQSAGLLKLYKSGKASFQIFNKALKLTPEAINLKEPDDVGYVFSGYAPISIRILEAAIKRSAWTGLSDEVLNTLPRPCFTGRSHKDVPLPTGSDRKKVVLVAFVGGVTYAEIAALRFLQSRPDFDAQIVIATSGFINGRSLILSFQDSEVEAASGLVSV